MINIPYYIRRIFQERKITDFLKERGIESSYETANRLMYKCPIHEGDNDPSFMVYTDSEFENYYCYGCHSGGNIINLIMDIDGIIIKDAIKRLINGLTLIDWDILEETIRNKSEELEGFIKVDNKEMEKISLKISRVVYFYLKKINFNKEEIIFWEKVFEKIDYILKNKDINTLRAVEKFISDNGVSYRLELFLKKQDDLILRKNIKNEKY